jgi:hypothetical protein
MKDVVDSARLLQRRLNLAKRQGNQTWTRLARETQGQYCDRLGRARDRALEA